MPDFPAPSDPSPLDITPYASVVEADSYFATRMFSEDWDVLENPEKTKALKMATRNISKLAFNYEEHKSSENVQIACCELALAFLNYEMSAGDILDTHRMKGTSFAGTRATYDTNILPDWVANLIPSPEAWAQLAPLVKQSSNFTLSKG